MESDSLNIRPFTELIDEAKLHVDQSSNLDYLNIYKDAEKSLLDPYVQPRNFDKNVFRDVLVVDKIIDYSSHIKNEALLVSGVLKGKGIQTDINRRLLNPKVEAWASTDIFYHNDRDADLGTVHGMALSKNGQLFSLYPKAITSIHYPKIVNGPRNRLYTNSELSRFFRYTKLISLNDEQLYEGFDFIRNHLARLVVSNSVDYIFKINSIS